ncbi:MAG TPA: hypothetical protein VIK99_10240 [Thermaerobacter sp.]
MEFVEARLPDAGTLPAEVVPDALLAADARFWAACYRQLYNTRLPKLPPGEGRRVVIHDPDDLPASAMPVGAVRITLDYRCRVRPEGVLVVRLHSARTVPWAQRLPAPVLSEGLAR